MGAIDDNAPVPMAYAHHARIVVANDEIYIDFLMIMPKFRNEEPMVRVVQRIVMPAERAEGMVKAFQVTAEAINSRKEQPKNPPDGEV